MNRTVRTVSVTSTLPSVDRTYTDDSGNVRRDERRSRGPIDVTTYVTTCSTRAQFTGKDGKLHVGAMETVRLYGLQGVSAQPAAQAPRQQRYADVTAAA